MDAARTGVLQDTDGGVLLSKLSLLGERVYIFLVMFSLGIYFYYCIFLI